MNLKKKEKKNMIFLILKYQMMIIKKKQKIIKLNQQKIMKIIPLLKVIIQKQTN